MVHAHRIAQSAADLAALAAASAPEAGCDAAAGAAEASLQTYIATQRRIGRDIREVRVGDYRSRWGSCAPDGTLAFSWRLVMAPDWVLDYVVAHEVAHLAHMDHSPAFWAVVARLVPDYPRHRRWLAANGAGLHAWQVR